MLGARIETLARKKEMIEYRHTCFQIMLDDIPPDHPYRQQCTENTPYSTQYLNDYVLFGMSESLGRYEYITFPDSAIQREIDYYVKLLASLIATGNPERFGAMWDHHTAWLDAIVKSGQVDEALDLTNKIIELSKGHKWRNHWNYQGLVLRRKRYERLIQGEPEPEPPKKELVTNGPGWENYEIRRLNLGFTPTPSTLFSDPTFFLLSAHNRLYCIRPVLDGPGHKRVVNLQVTTHWLPSGHMIGRINVPLGISVSDSEAGSGRWMQEIYAVALGQDVIYVGTSKGLLIISLQTHKSKLLTEKEGLPGTTVRALGWYAGKLYIGIGCDPYRGAGNDQSVFVVYDPQAASFELIASEKAVARDNPWNGVRFHLDDIVPDEQRNCLWLKDRRTGIWKYTLSTGSFEQIPPQQGKHFFMTTSRYIGACLQMACGGEVYGPRATLFRTNDLSLTDLPSGVIGGLEVQSYAVACDNNRLIASAERSKGRGRVFSLLEKAQPPSVLWFFSDGTPIPEISFLLETSAGIVGVGNKGEGLLIRRKGKEMENRREVTSG